MKWKLKQKVVCLIWATFVVAAEAQQEAGFSVDESNFKEIFNKSVTEQTEETKTKANFLDVELAGSYVTLQELQFSDPKFAVNYDKDFQTMPAVKLNVSKSLWRVGDLRISPFGSLGYAFKEQKTEVTTKVGSTLRDVITLQVLPIALGMEFRHKIPGTRRFSVFAQPGVGTEWINQTGSLDGINQNAWIGFWNLRGGVYLFENSRADTANWFDGVALSAGMSRAIGSDEKLATWSADLGVKLIL